MIRVRSLSNHPYGGRMRTKGSEYEVADDDLESLVALRRVVPVGEVTSDLTYATRELKAATRSQVSTRAKRRTLTADHPTTAADREI